MKSYSIVLFFIVQIFLQAQSNINHACLTFGYIKNYQSEFGKSDLNQYSFYPELSLGGKLFSEHIEWNILLGYWDDGIDKPSMIMDATTISFSAYVLGFRFYYLPKSDLFGIRHLKSSFSFGLTFDSITGKYISSIHGILPDINETRINPYLGWYSSYNVYKNIDTIGEV